MEFPVLLKHRVKAQKINNRRENEISMSSGYVRAEERRIRMEGKKGMERDKANNIKIQCPLP